MRFVEPRQRAHSPWVLPAVSASHAAGLTSESKLDRIPYGEDSPSLAARSFNRDSGCQPRYMPGVTIWTVWYRYPQILVREAGG